MGKIRALVLDFDGVILESNHVKTRAFERVFGRFPEHAAEMMAYHHAHVSESRFLQFRHLVVNRLGGADNDPLIGELAAAFSREVLAAMAGCSPVTGAPEFLATTSRRVPLFLASVTPQDDLEKTLACRGLSALFDRVYGCPPWTKAGALIDIARSLGGPDGILFVGDTASDQRAARAAGVQFIGRDSGLAFDDPRPLVFPDMSAVLSGIAGRLPESRGVR